MSLPSFRWPTWKLHSLGTSVSWVARPTIVRWMGLADWRVTESGWGHVFRDADRAGSTLLNFAVEDLAPHIADLSGRGLVPGTIETANRGVRLSAITDPDGNRITFIGNFRIEY